MQRSTVALRPSHRAAAEFLLALRPDAKQRPYRSHYILRYNMQCGGIQKRLRLTSKARSAYADDDFAD